MTVLNKTSVKWRWSGQSASRTVVNGEMLRKLKLSTYEVVTPREEERRCMNPSRLFHWCQKYFQLLILQENIQPVTVRMKIRIIVEISTDHFTISYILLRKADLRRGQDIHGCTLDGQPMFFQSYDLTRERLLFLFILWCKLIRWTVWRNKIKYSTEKLFRLIHFIWRQSYCNFLTWTHSDRLFSWCQVTARYQDGVTSTRHLRLSVNERHKAQRSFDMKRSLFYRQWQIYWNIQLVHTSFGATFCRQATPWHACANTEWRQRCCSIAFAKRHENEVGGRQQAPTALLIRKTCEGLGTCLNRMENLSPHQDSNPGL